MAEFFIERIFRWRRGEDEHAPGPCRRLVDHYYSHNSMTGGNRFPLAAIEEPTMTDDHRLLGIYLHLARASQMRMQPMVRDKLLVLAGVQAESMGLAPISALCRQEVLAHNAQHMLRDWPTLETALADERFRTYLKQLERQYSKEKSEHMLASLGIELGRERELYANNLEYAAALLGTDPESIDRLLQEPRDNSGTTARRGVDGWREHAASKSNDSRQALVVWGPFAVGLLILAALTFVAGALWQ